MILLAYLKLDQYSNKNKAISKILLALFCLLVGVSAVGYCLGGWCTACSSDFVCTTCTSDSYLVNGKCIPCPFGCATCNATACLTCSDGSSPVNNLCLMCSGGCNGCSLTPKNCTACNNLLVLSSTTHTCAVGTDCPDKNCATCNQKTTNASQGKFCQACSQNYYAYGGSCYLCPYPALTCRLDASTMFSANVQNLITGYVREVSGNASATVDYTNFTYWQKQNLFQFYLINAIMSANNLTINQTVHTAALSNLSIFANQTVTSRRLTDAEKVSIYASGGSITAAQLNQRMMNQVRNQLTHVACLDGFFNSGSKCVKCSSGCKSCSSASVCTQCFTDFALSTNACTRVFAPCLTSSGTSTTCTSCSPPYVLNSSNTCITCSVLNCQSCSTASQCTTCLRPYSRLPNSNNTCYLCTQPTCLHCNPSNTTICIECAMGYVLKGDTCASCPSNCGYCTYDSNSTAVSCQMCQWGYVLVNGACSACGVGCQQCSASDTTVCLDCRPQLYIDQSGVCQKCPVGCADCSEYQGICTKFLPGYSVLNGNVRRCAPGCKVCDSANPLTCLQCMNGNYLSTGTCLRCSNGCEACSSNATCTTCSPMFNLIGGQCKTCTGNCLTCGTANDTDLGNCLTCRRGFILNTATNKCSSSCGRGCIQCSGVNATCTRCANGFGLKSGTCVKCLFGCSGSCLATDITQCTGCGYGFQTNNAACARCPDGCLTCLSSQCTSCLSGYVLAQTGTGFSCQLGCNFPCSTCTSSGCTACATGYLLSNSVCTFDPSSCTNIPSCAASCPLGSYLSAGQCTACSSASCSACTASNCTQCFDGYYLSGTSCVACPSQCQTCSSDGTCTACGSGFTQQIISASTDPSVAAVSPSCTACNSRCLTCAAGSNYCLSCATGYRLRDSQCFGRNNAGFRFRFDKALSDFLSSASSDTITAKIASILGISQDDIIVSSLVSGSTIFTGSVSADSNAQAIALANTLYDTVKANSNALGLTATDYSVGAYYDDTQVSDSSSFRNIAGIIIGCSIAVGVLIIIILVVVCVIRKMKGSREQGDYVENDKAKQNKQYAMQVAQYDYTIPADGVLRHEQPTIHELKNYQ